MKITSKNIGVFAATADDYLAKVPGDSGERLRRDVLAMGAGDETLCLLTPDELTGNGTACGSHGNICFDDDVAWFLKTKGVDGVFVGVIQDEFCEVENMVVYGGAVRIPYGEDSERLSEMILKRGGSWRDDGCRVPGWSTYESE